MFTFRVAVRLPGDVESNAPTEAGNGAVWRPTLAEPGPIHLAASSEVVRWRTYAFIAVAVVAGLAALIVARSWACASGSRTGRHGRPSRRLASPGVDGEPGHTPSA